MEYMSTLHRFSLFANATHLFDLGDVLRCKRNFTRRLAHRNVNLADPCTKPNSPLTESLQLLLNSETILFDFPDCQFRDANLSTG